jgi:endonuclease YncB( thermonuclease family)
LNFSAGKLAFLIFFPALTATPNPAHTRFLQADLPNPVRAEVIGIQDGDTIELKYIYSGKKAGQRTGKPLRIRFLHVNSPERGRPFYKVAKEFTAKNCFRKKVEIRHAGNFDRYGRLLGEVILPGGKNLNKELVRNGLAVHFKKYSSSTDYANLENQAKKQRLGIWSQSGLFLGKPN